MTPLQTVISEALAAAPKARDQYDRAIQRRTGKSGKPLFDIQRGRVKAPKIITLRLIAEELQLPLTTLIDAVLAGCRCPLNG